MPPPNYAGNVQFPGPLNHPAPSARPKGRAGSDPARTAAGPLVGPAVSFEG